MKIKIEQAIDIARNNGSLEGFVIEDLTHTQVRAADALLLAEKGILIPEQNIYYNDDDIAYDPEFDDVEWSTELLKLTWEEKMQLAEKMQQSKITEEEISLKIKIENPEIRQWIHNNYDTIEKMLVNFIADLYQAAKSTDR